jgi:Chaperone of endosialidase
MKATIRLLVMSLALASLQFLPNARAVVPPPDGGYPGQNTAEGQNALFHLTIGTSNTAVGWSSLSSDTIGSFNTGVGAGTLVANTGDRNTATGAAALFMNTTGARNTADGTLALFHNSIGFNNTAVGDSALFSNAGGASNTATGALALFANTDGFQNTANGSYALENNNGSFNTAHGFFALRMNTTGDNNTAIGDRALLLNETGGGNTAIGAQALIGTASNSNTAVGNAALSFNTTGAFNIALGVLAGIGVTTADNVICIGADGADVSDSCFIGNIRDIQTQNDDAVAVVVDSAGQLGTVSSSKRFKTDIKPMDDASESILALRPVTFRYKNAKKGTPQFGLIAEEVAEVNPDLVVCDKNGDTYSVRYDQVNAMLLNEFLKQHRKVEEQGRKLERQETTIAALTKKLETVVAELKDQNSRIQKVSSQIDMSGRSAQVLAKSP